MIGTKSSYNKLKQRPRNNLDETLGKNSLKKLVKLVRKFAKLITKIRAKYSAQDL